jgi:integrase
MKSPNLWNRILTDLTTLGWIGEDIRYIQQFLGHTSLDTTKIYLRLVPGQLQKDYDRAMPEIEIGLKAGQ